MPSQHRPTHQRGAETAPARAVVPEDTLQSQTIQIERKTFIFTLRENLRGRFLRITEDVAGRRDHIIVPATGLEEFRRAVDVMAKASAETPLKAQP